MVDGAIKLTTWTGPGQGRKVEAWNLFGKVAAFGALLGVASTPGNWDWQAEGSFQRATPASSAGSNFSIP